MPRGASVGRLPSGWPADAALVAVHYASNDDAANEALRAIELTGGQAFSIRAELGVDGDLDVLFAGLQTGLAGQPLAILVNDAAIGASRLDRAGHP
ncbi:MAG: hypothetical protein ACLP8S_08750 [Solirubrobacteraceae bacterium]